MCGALFFSARARGSLRLIACYLRACASRRGPRALVCEDRFYDRFDYIVMIDFMIDVMINCMIDFMIDIVFF